MGFLGPDREVRLRYGYVIHCHEIVKDAAGEITELRCTYDPQTGGGKTPDGRKIKGIIHWVSATLGEPFEVRCFDRLFNVADPAKADDFREHLNPESLSVMHNAVAEGGFSDRREDAYQFERLGYFARDVVDSTSERQVFNRCVSLRDTWAKLAAAKN